MRSMNVGIPPPSRPPPVLAPPLEISYYSESQALVDLVKSPKDLPRVVKCDNSTVRSMRLPFNISQPLLLHSRRSVIKVAARSVVFDREKGSFQDTGEDIVVPEDYPGWFGVLGSPKDIKSEVNIPFYRGVAKLGITPCRQFLVGGTSCISGFTRIAGDQKWEHYIVSPGEVLRKIGVYMERKEPSRGTILKKKEKVVVKQYLRCYDTSDREIMLPATQEGVFYSLSQDGPSKRTPILTMSHILQRYKDKFPIVVKLLYGPVPTIRCAFKDTLRLTEAELSHTMIASTMENLRNINLEIPLESDMRFFPAVHNTALTSSRLYQQANADCEAKAPMYKRNMKVIVGFSCDENLPLPSPPPKSQDLDFSVDCSPSLNADERLKQRRDSSNSNGSTASVRIPESSSESSFRESSRLSVISRVITINSEEQNVFVPKIPQSPDTPTSPKIRQASKSRKKYSNKSSMPGELALVEDFRPPPEPQMIQAVSSSTSISNADRQNQNMFHYPKQEPHVYEPPGPLQNSCEDMEDHDDTYVPLWPSASIDRSSRAGVRIDSIPGKPKNSQSDFDPPPLNCLSLEQVTYDMFSSPEFPSPQIVNMREHPFRVSPSPSLASSISSSSNQSNQDISGFQKDQVTVPNEPVYENTISPSPGFSFQTSGSSTQQPYNAPNTEENLYQHVYNDLKTEQERATQGLQYPSSFPAPRAITKNLNGTSYFHESEGAKVEYLSPIEMNYYATPKDFSNSGNHYEKTSDVWQETDLIRDGFAYFELKSVGQSSCRDSGVEEDDLPELTDEDPYDYPTSSARQSMAVGVNSQPIYVRPKPETTLQDALQQRLKENSERMILTSSSPSDGLNTPCALPLHLNITSPPPLPSNHPANRLTQNKTVFNPINNIHNMDANKPEVFNKDVLIEELKKSGIKATSELAFQSLQVADVTMLAQKQEDLDDILVTLLPTVGTVDLRKISMCIKNLRNKISRNTK